MNEAQASALRAFAARLRALDDFVVVEDRSDRVEVVLRPDGRAKELILDSKGKVVSCRNLTI